MRPYYEDPCRYSHHHHHHRPNIEIDVFPGWGGSYYPPPAARPEVVIVSPATNYMPLPGGQAMMPQPYTGMSQGGAGYYQQQQGYQYQYQQYNTPPYPQW
ncbi:transcription factor Sox-1 [Drosophila montana]|uniref:transcription factor Sox-1 n=1 Tax=Drosophila montana TaxID=40370 RepID=UPI00313DEC49